MNYKETDILVKLKFLSTNQRKDVLQFIDDLKGSHSSRKTYRRRAMIEIRQALNGQF